MRLVNRLANRIITGTILPGVILGALEIPLLVFYFSGLNLSDVLYFTISTTQNVPSQALLLFLISLAFSIGLLVKESSRAIKMFTLSQVIAFSLSILPLFVYPNTTQKELTLAPCCLPDFQLLSRLEIFVAGWAILSILLGFVITGVGSLIGERLAQRLNAIK